jgi:DNA-binding IclR family transcriptional regulator
VNRLLHLLHAHGLIAKIPRSHRYRLTIHGAMLMSAVVYLRTQDFPAAMQKVPA